MLLEGVGLVLLTLSQLLAECGAGMQDAVNQ
jgi:hypothetical protein